MSGPVSALSTVEPSAERLRAAFDELGDYRQPERPGWSRPVFSAEYRESRRWLEGHMRDAGLETRVDPAGNIVGLRRGSDPVAPALMTGSHTDTVDGGGRYDGVVGVLGAIAAVRALDQANIKLKRDLIIVDFLGEEANDFGVSCLGSRAMTGALTAAHLNRCDESGRSLGVAMAGIGLDPAQALTARVPRRVHGFVELHVEQGPRLERAGASIGVVTAIAGIQRLLLRLTGRADHAGTMPMDQRHDALVVAAAAVLAVEREGCGAPVHGVATVGRLETAPGAMNVVPASADVWAEVRSVESEWLDSARRNIVQQISTEAAARGVDHTIEWLNDQVPVRTHKAVRSVIAEATAATGHSWEAVPSGAGHDSAHLATLAPMGMIFIPSQGGRSHCPEEHTDLADIVSGVRVLAATLAAMDSAELR